MPPAGFELVIPASDRPPTLVLDRSATDVNINVNVDTSFSQLLLSRSALADM